jgi:4,5-DOPA dioxygenase extradiol
VLCHVFPEADIPVIQLSIDETQPASFHFELGKKLLPLRDEGVLILGSGNVVHNLHAYAWGQHPVEPLDWAIRFENFVRQAVLSGNDEALIYYERGGQDAILSAPTPDHYLPLLYMIAVRKENEEITLMRTRRLRLSRETKRLWNNPSRMCVCISDIRRCSARSVLCWMI